MDPDQNFTTGRPTVLEKGVIEQLQGYVRMP